MPDHHHCFFDDLQLTAWGCNAAVKTHVAEGRLMLSIVDEEGTESAVSLFRCLHLITTAEIGSVCFSIVKHNVIICAAFTYA